MIDPGIEMNKESAQAFGNYRPDEPGVPVPENGVAGRDLLQVYANAVTALASQMKEQAALQKNRGHKMLGLLITRSQLQLEETGEFIEALASGDLVRAAAELTDIVYSADGSYGVLGISDLKLPLYRETHRANMSKMGPDGKPIISAAGRWVKGPNFVPADIAGVLEGRIK